MSVGSLEQECIQLATKSIGRPQQLRLCVFETGSRSSNFVIGVTNVSYVVAPAMWGNYSVCAQYPGAVPDGATVSLQCTAVDQPPARYVIVQFPINGTMNFCELDVCAEGTPS